MSDNLSLLSAWQDLESLRRHTPGCVLKNFQRNLAEKAKLSPDVGSTIP